MSAPTIAETLAALDGLEVPGGCDTCDAYQTLATISGGLSMLTVHHDDWCPTLQRISRKAVRR